MGGLDWNGAVQDIRGAVLHLKKNGCKKVGVLGYARKNCFPSPPYSLRETTRLAARSSEIGRRVLCTEEKRGAVAFWAAYC